MIHTEGWRFIGIFLLVSILLALLYTPLGWIGGILTVWCAYFFRSPDRVVPLDDNLIISPADGKVVGVTKVKPPEDYNMGEEEVYRVSIFLNIFDVHATRSPTAGTVEKIMYHPGQFFNASFDKASDENERNTTIIERKDGQKLAVVQIAGLIARRICCYKKDSDSIQTGESYGFIRFGSRVDVYLPAGVVPQIIKGQRAIGGETVIADLRSSELREGIVM